MVVEGEWPCHWTDLGHGPDPGSIKPLRAVEVALEKLLEELCARFGSRRGIFGKVTTDGYLIEVDRGYELHTTEDPESPHIRVESVSGSSIRSLSGLVRVTGYLHGERKEPYLSAMVVKVLSDARFSAGGL